MKSLIDFALLVALYIFVFYKKWHLQGNDILFINTLMYIYLSFVLYFTLMPIITALPFIFDHPYIPMNLEPFIDVVTERGNFTQQIILNIIMTVPFGFLLPLTQAKRFNLPKVILLTFLLSLSIELIQPLLSSSRSSDITDIITNVIGGIIGYILYLAFRPLTTKILKSLAKPHQPQEETEVQE